MKRLLTYLFLVLSLLVNTIVLAEEKKMVTIDGNKRIIYESNDKNFTKKLEWDSSSYDKPPFRQTDDAYKEKRKQMGSECFYSFEAYTYNGKQIAFEFVSRGKSSSQTDMCVSEVYKIWAEPANSINYVI